MLSFAVLSRLVHVTHTRRIAFLVCCALLSLAVFGESAKPPDLVDLVGDWQGTSLCQLKPSACHDETVVFRFSNPRNDSNTIAVQADKIVDGSPVTMGVGDWHSDKDKGELTWTIPQGTWSLLVTGTTMNGTLKLPDGRLFRKIQLTRFK